MRTRDQISENHDHPDQGNYDPTTDGGALLRDALLVSEANLPRHDALRAGWAPRIVDPRTITTSRVADQLETPWTRR